GAKARSSSGRIGDLFLGIWVNLLRRRLRRAGLAVNDHLFGVTWTGAMTEARVMRLLPHVPDGVSEVYFHPAVAATGALACTMPDYRHDEEFAGLVSPAVRRGVADAGISLIAYGDLIAGQSCSASR